MLDRDGFGVFADSRGWCHPYDADGQRVGIEQIPKHLADLVDDPFRSLAAALRRAGGYAKEAVPFAGFIGADALRRRIARGTVETAFAAALTAALIYARSREAKYLPGWCGPDS